MAASTEDSLMGLPTTNCPRFSKHLIIMRCSRAVPPASQIPKAATIGFPRSPRQRAIYPNA